MATEVNPNKVYESFKSKLKLSRIEEANILRWSKKKTDNLSKVGRIQLRCSSVPKETSQREKSVSQKKCERLNLASSAFDPK